MKIGTKIFFMGVIILTGGLTGKIFFPNSNLIRKNKKVLIRQKINDEIDWSLIRG